MKCPECGGKMPLWSRFTSSDCPSCYNEMINEETIDTGLSLDQILEGMERGESSKEPERDASISSMVNRQKSLKERMDFYRIDWDKELKQLIKEGA